MVETTFRQEFDAFRNIKGLMGDWKNNLDHVFFDEDALDRYLVIRRQSSRSSSCYMHSAIVFVHYVSMLRSGKTNETNHKMLDMSTYIRNDMDREEVKQYIINPRGDHAGDFVKTITGLGRFDMQKTCIDVGAHCHNLSTDIVLWWLKVFGEPLLITDFFLEKDFTETANNGALTQRVSFSGPINRNNLTEHTFEDGTVRKEVLHSMLMIGGYRDSTINRAIFLLQNWWEDKYFVEVDSEYLASTGCTISRVIENTPVVLKETFDWVDADYAEAYSPMETGYKSQDM